jgi:phytoene dehydrogenase-like protein
MDAVAFPIYGTVISCMDSVPVYAPKKTTYEISAKMAQRFVELGGTLLCNTRAEKILVEKGKVTGVITQRGEVFKPIMSTATPCRTTYSTTSSTPKTSCPQKRFSA